MEPFQSTTPPYYVNCEVQFTNTMSSSLNNLTSAINSKINIARPIFNGHLASASDYLNDYPRSNYESSISQPMQSN